MRSIFKRLHKNQYLNSKIVLGGGYLYILCGIRLVRDDSHVALLSIDRNRSFCIVL